MKNLYRVRWVFCACVVVVFAAVGWLSLRTLELHASADRAWMQAAFEGKIRLALWRMDSAISPLILAESARPAEAPPSARRSELGGSSSQSSQADDWEPVSPDLAEIVSERFEFDARGLISPASLRPPHAGQWPVAIGSAPAPPTQVDNQVPQAAAQVATQAERAVDFGELLSQLPDGAQMTNESPPPGFDPANALNFAANAPAAQQALSSNEKQVRSQMAERQGVYFSKIPQAYATQPTAAPSAPAPPARIGPVTAVWLDQDLVLMRKVVRGAATTGQAARINWAALRTYLLGVIQDLLPTAQLEPVRVEPADDQGRQMAMLPVRLMPGEPEAVVSTEWSPVHVLLALVWGSLLLATAAGAVVVSSLVALSERRAAFVSAVTHELRTPLTTFRLYAEMLRDGVVPEDRRSQYLDTLQSEADRLTHLVENVLSYARLERATARLPLQSFRVDELLAHVLPRLAERAERGGLRLTHGLADDVEHQVVLAHLASVEQVLLNLVDNACKYAQPRVDNELRLLVRAERRKVVLRVQDTGPGVTRAVQGRLFRPFHKSAADAALSAPGVGLGLAFSRRLARSLGGDLKFDRGSRQGAAFELWLPLGRG